MIHVILLIRRDLYFYDQTKELSDCNGEKKKNSKTKEFKLKIILIVKFSD